MSPVFPRDCRIVNILRIFRDRRGGTESGILAGRRSVTESHGRESAIPTIGPSVPHPDIVRHPGSLENQRFMIVHSTVSRQGTSNNPNHPFRTTKICHGTLEPGESTFRGKKCTASSLAHNAIDTATQPYRHRPSPVNTGSQPIDTAATGMWAHPCSHPRTRPHSQPQSAATTTTPNGSRVTSRIRNPGRDVLLSCVSGCD